MDKKFNDGVTPKYYIQMIEHRTMVLRRQKFYWKLLASNRLILSVSEKYSNYSDMFQVVRDLSNSLGGDDYAPIEDYTDRGISNDIKRNYNRILF